MAFCAPVALAGASHDEAATGLRTMHEMHLGPNECGPKVIARYLPAPRALQLWSFARAPPFRIIELPTRTHVRPTHVPPRLVLSLWLPLSALGANSSLADPSPWRCQQGIAAFARRGRRLALEANVGDRSHWARLTAAPLTTKKRPDALPGRYPRLWGEEAAVGCFGWDCGGIPEQQQQNIMLNACCVRGVRKRTEIFCG